MLKFLTQQIGAPFWGYFEDEDDVWFCIAWRKKKRKNDEVKGEGYILNSILYSLFYGFCDF